MSHRDAIVDRLRRSRVLSYPAAVALRLYHALGPRPRLGAERDYEAYFAKRGRQAEADAPAVVVQQAASPDA